MDLLIRSQDETKLVKFESEIYFIERDCGEIKVPVEQHYDHWDIESQKKIKYEIYCNKAIFLGEYKSKQRALEVIDKIQWHIADIRRKRHCLEKGWERDNTPEAFDEVFEMPKE